MVFPFRFFFGVQANHILIGLRSQGKLSENHRGQLWFPYVYEGGWGGGDGYGTWVGGWGLGGEEHVRQACPVQILPQGLSAGAYPPL